jgi:hypothetical protein
MQAVSESNSPRLSSTLNDIGVTLKATRWWLLAFMRPGYSVGWIEGALRRTDLMRGFRNQRHTSGTLIRIELISLRFLLNCETN